MFVQPIRAHTAPKAKRKLPAIPEAATTNAALAAAIECVRSLKDEERRLWDEHTALEDEEIALRRRLGVTRPNTINGQPSLSIPKGNPEYDRLVRVVDQGEARAQAARARVDRAAKAMLRIDVSDPADTLLKLQVFAAAMDARDPSQLVCEDDYPEMVRAAVRDLKALRALPERVGADASPAAGADPAADRRAQGACPDRAAWEAAVAEYEAQLALYRAEPDDRDEACGDMTDALEALQRLPPPDLQALVYVMRQTIQHGAVLEWRWADADDPNSISDLLSGGDAAEAALARFWLWTLQLAGERSPALSASYFDDFDWQGALGDEEWDLKKVEAAYHAHHELRQLAQVFNARAMLDEYRSLGGDFTYHPGHDGHRAVFGTIFPDTFSSRADDIEREIVADKRKAKLIARELQIEARTREAQQDIEEELSARTLESGVAA